MDLQFPHHENEIAQSEGASGEPFVNCLAAQRLPQRRQREDVQVTGQLLHHSRRAGSVTTARRCAFSCCARTTAAPSISATRNLDDARAALSRLYTALDGIDVPRAAARLDAAAGRRVSRGNGRRLQHAAGALAVLFDLASELNRSRAPHTAALLKGLGEVLGVLQQAPRAFLQGGADAGRRQHRNGRSTRAPPPSRRGTSPPPTASATSLAEHGVMLKDSAARHDLGQGMTRPGPAH